VAPLRAAAWCPLQVRLIDLLFRQRRTLSQVLKPAGINYTSVWRWIRERDSTLIKPTIEQLAELVEIPVEVAIREVGGKTFEDVRVQRGKERRAALLESGAIPTPELEPEQFRAWQTRAARSKRGPRSAQHTAAVQAGRARTGALGKVRQQLIERAHSNQHRMILSLRNHLRYTTSATQEERRAWADEVADWLDLCSREVIDAWNVYLRRHGLPQIGGRPSSATRCRDVRAYLLTKPKRYGLWKMAPESKGWCQDHERGCPTLRRYLLDVRSNRMETPTARPDARAEVA